MTSSYPNYIKVIYIMNKSFKKWINSSGRASRLEFFIITVISITALFLITLLCAMIFKSLWGNHVNSTYTREYAESAISSAIFEYLRTGSAYGTANALAQDYQTGLLENGIIAAFSYLLFLPFAIVWITGAIRRLHDIGTFGWWIVIVLAPIWLFFDNWILIAPLLFLFFKDGQRFYNKYVPDPKNPNAPVPLEMPKESEKLVQFEIRVLEIVEKIKAFLHPYIQLIMNKFKK